MDKPDYSQSVPCSFTLEAYARYESVQVQAIPKEDK